jgi:hypothetical protein
MLGKFKIIEIIVMNAINKNNNICIFIDITTFTVRSVKSINQGSVNLATSIA